MWQNATLNEVDVVLWLVEPSTFIGAGEKHIIEQLKRVKTPVILVINKIDMVKREEVLLFIDAYRKEYDFAGDCSGICEKRGQYG